MQYAVEEYTNKKEMADRMNAVVTEGWEAFAVTETKDHYTVFYRKFDMSGGNGNNAKAV